jgi:hypothetical protein
MSMNYRDRTTITRPAAPPIDLNDGRLDMRLAAMAGVFVLASIAVDACGMWVIWIASGVTIRLFGAAILVVGIAFGASVLSLSIGEWLDHRRRIQDWHDLALATWAAGAGAESIEQVSEWSFTVENPAHVLVCALWVHQRIMDGESIPYSTRALRGPIFLAGRRVGDLSKGGAELMGRRFAALGLISGRGETQAGEWIPGTADDVMRIVLRHW